MASNEDSPNGNSISDGASREVAGNFLRILVSNTLTKVGDRLANTKSTIAWLLQSLGAPVYFTGLVVPLREVGSLLPQLLIAGYVRKLALRKWVWVGGSIVQGLAVIGMATVAVRLSGASAGWALVLLLVFFSLARGFCSVASKDVMGKAIPKGQRGRLGGWMSSASGLITMVAGAGLIAAGQSRTAESPTALYGGFLLMAGLLWLVASGVFTRVVEFKGETDRGTHVIADALRQLSLLKSDKNFRQFVIVRALAMGSALSAPFIVALAYRELDGRALWLGVFTIVDGLAALLSGPLWGRLSDRSSRSVLRITMLSTGCFLTVVVGAAIWIPVSQAFWLFPLFLFVLGLIHNGVRLGRKTYLIDLADGNKRTSYVAVSNTLIGVLLMLGGIASGFVALLSIPATLSLLALCAFTGFVLGKRLPEVSGH